jgi:hypothetical protein
MIKQKLQTLFNKGSMVVIGLLLAGFVAISTLSATTYAADATYSCGSYGHGAYSNNACNGGAVGAPNTGFAKLMQPSNLIAIIGSLILLGGGITLILKARSRKKQNVAFAQRD